MHAFAGASIGVIQRSKADKAAKADWKTQNDRSTAPISAAANSGVGVVAMPGNLTGIAAWLS